MIDMRTGTCALCGHNEIIESVPQDAWGESGKDRSDVHLAEEKSASLFSASHFQYGRVKQYTCRSCGFIQSFADSPNRIPTGSATWTRVIQGPPKPGP